MGQIQPGRFSVQVVITSLFAAMFIQPCFSAPQTNTDRVYSQVRVNRLDRLAAEYKNQERSVKQEAIDRAKENNWPVRFETERGRVIELQRLRKTGPPVYYATQNIDAAATVSTSSLWPAGEMGLNLTGSGMILGEWDAGAVLATHQELTGRVNQPDGATALNDHATHVAGTLIGAGIVNNAIGMAYEAGLHTYDWNYDQSETAGAAANGLLVSNHSYGMITGWYWNYFDDSRWAWFGAPTVSETEDYAFGWYNTTARNWDEIAYNAPYYLVVKSAGNDRNSGPVEAEEHWAWIDGDWELSSVYRSQDGPYDCIAGMGVAKNVLTVGAVKDISGGYGGPGDVDMTSFSSWGPTDDGRIKPDIVANGYQLFSSVSSGESHYSTYSGTSMASPNVAGSLLLLQQRYQETHGNGPMLAATLKGLVVQTADAAGTGPGPDYRFGWGLFNARRAAEFIGQNGFATQILEETLADSEIYTVEVPVDSGSPLTVTVSWTDPAGEPGPEVLDSAHAVLVNDLDLRIRTDESELFFPFVLDPANPSSVTTTGDNRIDNIEKIFIANPDTGIYTVTVGHKGTLTSGSQDFSLLINRATGGQPVYGDASGDGIVGPYDAALVLSHVAGNSRLDGPEFSVADVTGNGAVTSYDASLILRYSVGAITCFPVEPDCDQ